MTTLVELVLQELEETEPANVNIEPPPYDRRDKTKIKVRKTYQALMDTARLRNNEVNRIKSLVYAYYLGELLANKPKTPAQRTVLANLLTKHYEKAATRVYKIFSPYGIDAIYRTKHLLLSSIPRLRTSDLYFLC
jgi:hypothetical protein